MDLAAIVVPEDEARAKLAEYEAAIRQERNAQDEALALGYRAAARGLAVIRLSAAVTRGAVRSHAAKVQLMGTFSRGVMWSPVPAAALDEEVR
jgi:hypothetical protein